MKKQVKDKILQVCNEKINKKGITVGVSFYAFFSNKNTDPETLIEVAQWWIVKRKLDHFEKAEKVKNLILLESD